MDTSSYLFMSKRKKLKFALRALKAMEKRSSSDSDISIDSLENNFRRKTSLKNETSEENVDTILVPFYENDVLIKVPKNQKRKQNNSGNKHKTKELQKRDFQQPNSYLINKDKQKLKRSSYLEMFRKQFGPNKVENKIDHNEISSLLPEYGDTERESISEDANHPPMEFFNTESYNEIYYEKMLNRDLAQYLDNAFEEGLQFTGDIISKSHDGNPDNLKSISEVSQPRRRVRRATVQPIENIKLGGLGPDIEKIKPRLERARSLQRYSEKVRIENRLKIYKQSLQADDKKEERKLSGKQRESDKNLQKEFEKDHNTSYLMNKTANNKKSKLNNKIWSKSAGIQRTTERLVESSNEKSTSKEKDDENDKKKRLSYKTKIKNGVSECNNDKIPKIRVRSNSKNKAISTEIGAVSGDVPPVQISFMVNVGGVRPSSALKTLEEKHRMYQEQVKAFMDNNG